MLGGSLVTTAWRILWLRMEEDSRYGGYTNILNKHSRTDGKAWFSSLGVGRGANKP